MAPPTKSSKVATKGGKQIVTENLSTLDFYKMMILGASFIYIAVTGIFFEFTTSLAILAILSLVVNGGCYQFMHSMSKAKFSESGQILDSGIDLNMEGGIAEHIKDLIILNSGVLVLSLLSNYLMLLWLLAPLRGLWMLWTNILGPWFFASPVEPEIDEKKQRKLERKMARRH